MDDFIGEKLPYELDWLYMFGCMLAWLLGQP